MAAFYQKRAQYVLNHFLVFHLERHYAHEVFIMIKNLSSRERSSYRTLTIVRGIHYLFAVFFWQAVRQPRRLHNYDKMVDVKDGVSVQEQKIIAQRMLINTRRRMIPDIFPGHKNRPDVYKYPDYCL